MYTLAKYEILYWQLFFFWHWKFYSTVRNSTIILFILPSPAYDMAFLFFLATFKNFFFHFGFLAVYLWCAKCDFKIFGLIYHICALLNFLDMCIDIFYQFKYYWLLYLRYFFSYIYLLLLGLRSLILLLGLQSLILLDSLS